MPAWPVVLSQQATSFCVLTRRAGWMTGTRASACIVRPCLRNRGKHAGSLSTRRAKAPTVVVGQDRGEARASATRARAVHHDLLLTRERKETAVECGTARTVCSVHREGPEPLGTWTCRERPAEGARLTSYKEPKANQTYRRGTGGEMMCRLWLVPVTVDRNVETDSGVPRERKRP